MAPPSLPFSKMNTIMAKTPYDSSFSSSQRNLHWTNHTQHQDHIDELSLPFAFKYSSSFSLTREGDEKKEGTLADPASPSSKKKLVATMAVLRLRSVLAAIGKTRWHVPLPSDLGSQMIGIRRGQNMVSGTLFGCQGGHIYLALQGDPKGNPDLLVKLATPTSMLVREMASGLVRIVLQCDKKGEKRGQMRLMDEPFWTTYCNGRRCGFAMKRKCGPAEWNVLKAIEPISMGAGMLPRNGAQGEVMYMRARFDRVVGSRDSEAFYMINPEPGRGGPHDLSIFLVRI
ncbi:protein MIZU-KUSSEI 1-like protein [Cinnamomum micranthum f. kanehirae]|uniref:Protein MIZU-KUSSEI 1-like protein n=1 Tax=Cinnamomum micranthum f. kanehirae TaxID=337451 RepID=A0A3S3ML35_9MAGN|nr:protein MIZU-KUSSEI 1-like protein [Cinnamomum micranthum f. kanehirae]